MDINFRPVDYSKPLKNSGAELAIGWPLDLVAAKLEAGDKEALVAFIGQRYEERFLRPIRSLGSAPKNSQGYGFAIMALCSLLIESLQSYRYGLPTTNGREFDKLGRFDVPPAFRIPATDRRNGEQVFCDFFSHAPNQELFPGVDGLTYYRAIRNGLLHQAQTKEGWRIKTGQSYLWNLDQRIVDRRKFAGALNAAFKEYLTELNAAGWDDHIWLMARRKIWWLMRFSA